MAKEPEPEPEQQPLSKQERKAEAARLKQEEKQRKAEKKAADNEAKKAAKAAKKAGEAGSTAGSVEGSKAGSDDEDSIADPVPEIEEPEIEVSDSESDGDHGGASSDGAPSEDGDEDGDAEQEEEEQEQQEEEEEEEDPVMKQIRDTGVKLLELVEDRGNTVEVELLLHGIGVVSTQVAVANYQEEVGSLPPLHRAARNKSTQLCASLLMYGAELDSLAAGSTPLQLACLPPFNPVWKIAPTAHSTDLPVE
jgi:hypothetical protein